MHAPPLLPTKRRSSDWWSRHWKWLVPAVCLAGVAPMAGLLFMLPKFMKSTGAYTGAVARARTDASVVAALGTPIKEGYFVFGSFHIKGDSGEADLRISLEGPRGEAVVTVVSRKAGAKWHYDRLIVHLDKGRGDVDLSDP